VLDPVLPDLAAALHCQRPRLDGHRRRGREYLDFTSGQMCATIGHNHPRVVKALELSAQGFSI
jgi:acetylornithine/succinyldiaminopimelate/putrescine aminotransferase